ncbi:MAG: efflux RND transporter periplasmic adaptor subunit [Calditrichaeota bacterium]|nr:efflux RND transporter periplasmic adaptor subunit [Calditrichota bacterium]MCB9087281.1 efflux RND transporter periplasmic adaptor subunit [Calditrichia bacterium]
MKNFATVLLILLTCLVLAGCSSGDANSAEPAAADSSSAADSTQKSDQDTSGGEAKKDGSGKDQPTAIPVEITRLTTGQISSFLLYSSTLETEQTVNVYSRIAGLVEEIYVEESDRVQKGARLIQIEKDEYVLAERKARLEYEKLLADYNRLKALQAEELLSEEEFLTAEINMKQAEIAWEQAKLNLEYTTVTAPISGVIGDRLVNLGDRIQTSTNLFTIANLNEKIVRLYVPQSEFAKCYKNQTAKVTTDVMAGTKFNGYVKRISPIIDPQSGTFKVTIAVKDPQNKLRPGMFVNAELIVDTHENAKLIPKSALIYENERTYFFIVSQDSSQKLELKKGFEDAEKVEILNDLEAGTQIVVLGQNGLKDGSRVKIVEEKKYRWQANGETSGISALLPRR